MFDLFSESARLVVFQSRILVSELGGDAITPAHLLLGMVRVAPHLFENPEVLTEKVLPVAEGETKPPTHTDVPLASESVTALQKAAEIAGEGAVIEPEHLLEGLRSVVPGLLS